MSTKNKKYVQLVILVPVYNTELYVSEFLDSLLDQSFRDFIVCLVDDGSLDHSLEIIKAYAKKDHRVVILHKKNSGVSSARNYGLDYIDNFIKCEYIYFCDSDDLLGPDSLQICINAMNENKSDISIFSVAELKQNGISYRKRIMLSNRIIYSDDIIRQYFRDGMLWYKNSTSEAFLNNKIFRAGVIKGYRFDENLRRAEDFDFYLSALHKLSSASICSNAWYYYRKRKSSLTQQNINTDELMVCKKHYLNADKCSCLLKKLLQHRLIRSFYLAVYSKYEQDKLSEAKAIINDFRSFDFLYKRTISDKKIFFIMNLPYKLLFLYMAFRRRLKKTSLQNNYFK